jgi:hypothetical protein
LVSHYTANRVIRQSQIDLHDHLTSAFSPAPKWVSVRVTGRSSGALPFPADQERESSQRTRSFLFLSIAATVARRTGFYDLLLVGENGQMAINLPLTPARIGAFSTHTAHPEVLSGAVQYLSELLKVPFTVTNPFLYSTKSEVVARLAKSRDHKTAIPRSVSCWRASRQAYS